MMDRHIHKPDDGIIDVHVLNERGFVKVDKRGQRPLSKRYHGKVEVVPCD